MYVSCSSVKAPACRTGSFPPGLMMAVNGSPGIWYAPAAAPFAAVSSGYVIPLLEARATVVDASLSSAREKLGAGVFSSAESEPDGGRTPGRRKP